VKSRLRWSPLVACSVVLVGLAPGAKAQSALHHQLRSGTHRAAAGQSAPMTITVSVLAYGTKGQTPTVVTGLSPTDPEVMFDPYEPDGVVGTLKCQTPANVLSPVGVYSVSGCNGLSDPAGDTFVYDYSLLSAGPPKVYHSEYFVLPADKCSSSCPTLTIKVQASAPYGSETNSAGWLDDIDPTLTVTATNGSDQSGNLAGVLNCSTPATATSGVGTYPLSLCSGLTDYGYTIKYDYPHSSYTVTKAPLIITASSFSAETGSAIPSVTPEYAGLVGTDSQTATPPTCLTSATSTRPPATYPAVCYGAADPNYRVTYVDGKVILTPPVGTSPDRLGSSVAISADGSTALVGAPGRTVNGLADAGAAEVYVRNNSGGWDWSKELTEPAPAAGDRFGASVALNGDGTTGVVGAPFYDYSSSVPDSGVAYVFTNGWSTQQTVDLGSASSAGDQFGASVSIDGAGTNLAIGAPFRSVPEPSVIVGGGGGCLRVRSQIGVTDSGQPSVIPCELGAGLWHTGLALVRGSDVLAAHAGEAFTFAPNLSGTWAQSSELNLGYGARTGDEFGFAVAINRDAGVADDGTALVVGAPYAHARGVSGPITHGGAAFAYSRVQGVSTWQNNSTMLDLSHNLGAETPSAAADDGLGWSVSLSANGSTALVGVPFRALDLAVDDGSGYNYTGTYVSSTGGSLTIQTSSGQLTFTVDSKTLYWNHSGNRVASLSYAAGENLEVVVSAKGGTQALSVDAGPPNGYDRGLPQRDLRQDAGAGELFHNTTNGWAWQRELSLGGHYPSSCILSVKQPAGDGTPHVSTWTYCASRDQPAGDAGDELGFSVSLSASGTIALLGAPERTMNRGTFDVAGQSGGGAGELFAASGAWITELSLGLNASQVEQPLGDPPHFYPDELGSSVALSIPTGSTMCSNTPHGWVLEGAPSRMWNYLRDSGAAEFYTLHVASSTTKHGDCYWNTPPAQQVIDNQLTRRRSIDLPVSMVQMGDSVSSGEGTGYGYSRDQCGAGSVLRWCPMPRDPPPFGRDGQWMAPYPRCHDSPYAYSQVVRRDLNADPNFEPNGPRDGNAVNLVNFGCTGGAFATFSNGTGGGFKRYEEYGNIVRRPAEFGDLSKTPPTELNHSYFEAAPNEVQFATGPNDVQFADIAAWCVKWDIAANTAKSVSLALLPLAVSPVRTVLNIIAKFGWATCTPNGYDHIWQEDWDPQIDQITSYMTTLAKWVRLRATWDLQPPPKVVMLNYMSPVNPNTYVSRANPHGWCPDDWIGSRIRLGRLFGTLRPDQRNYFSSQFGVLENEVGAAFGSADANANISDTFAKNQWCSEADHPNDPVGPGPNGTGSWDYGLSLESLGQQVFNSHHTTSAPFHPTICGQEHIADAVEVAVRLALDPAEPPPAIDDDGYHDALAVTLSNLHDAGGGTFTASYTTGGTIPILSRMTVSGTAGFNGSFVVLGVSGGTLTLGGIDDSGSAIPDEPSGQAYVAGAGPDALACNPSVP